MTSAEIRKKYLEFFESKGHKIIPSASLVPENDPTTLFTGSGMQPMVPYLLGEKHPLGTRIADSQKSFRTVDIEEVGDNRHTTFFEMLGNWSLGDYFKKEQIPWMFEFLTEVIGIDPNKLYVTVFIGDAKNNIPRDDESADIWQALFKKKNIEAKIVPIGPETNGYQTGMHGGRIFYYDVKKNWWSRAGTPENMPAGEPGGPDSEMFYEFTDIDHDKKFGEHCHPNCDCGRFLEIGNNVFMEYIKNSDGTFSKLPQQNVDFGGGLERMTMAIKNSPDVIEVNHRPILDYIEKISNKTYGKNKEETKAFRVIADHLKASVFLIGDGVTPSNTDQGYYVRRLLRRAIRYMDKLEIKMVGLYQLVDSVVDSYRNSYPELILKSEKIKNEIEIEESKFRKTLKEGLRQFNMWHKIAINNGQKILPSHAVFQMVTTNGFPFELIKEMASEKGLDVDENTFEKDMKNHKELSRSGSEQKFKGGLGGTGIMETRYHTATHLLRRALEEVLGEKIMQKGSNITSERLRFDFGFGRKVTDEEKQKVEDIVNQKISENLPVNKVVMKREEAEKTGATHVFGDKYGDDVSIYYIGDSLDSAWSKEFCGGPHVSRTGDLASGTDPERAVSESKGPFKITKEESVSAGIRRIKAILE
jgi:alanyl-tRNA synthetase